MDLLDGVIIEHAVAFLLSAVPVDHSVAFRLDREAHPGEAILDGSPAFAEDDGR